MAHPREGWQGHGMPRRRFLTGGAQHGGNGGPALNALGSIMLAMSLIIVIIGYIGYRLLTRGERGGSLAALAALTAISGEGQAARTPTRQFIVWSLARKTGPKYTQ